MEEFHMSTVLLPAIRRRYRSIFNLLEIPEVLRSDWSDEKLTVYFRYYDGETYNDRWNEGNGGSPLGTQLSSEVVRVLDDLKQIDIDWLTTVHPVGETVRQSAFNLQDWRTSFRQRTPQALSL